MKAWVRTAVITLSCLAALVGVARVEFARAEEDGFGTSYLNPFPPNELYNIAVIGDDLADGLHYGLNEALSGDRRLALRPKSFSINGLNRPDFADKLSALETALKTDTPQIAIVMLGAWDRVSLRDEVGKKLAVGSDPWRQAYAQRADQVIKMLKRLKIAVYWASLPNVRRADMNDDVQMINEVLRERIFLNGIKYVDIYSGFLDEQGGYDAYGPDLTGKIVRLRDGDGVYFTGSGNRKLAHFVERDLRRDLADARTNRDVPLAGAETEQSKINPDKVKLAAPAPDAAGEKAANATSAPPSASPGAVPAQAAGPSEQKAETGKISLKMLTASGREETLTLDIVRPQISASVVQLVTRRESADKPAQMGDNLINTINGDLLVLNSVSPATSAASRNGAPKVSAAQTPYFRVLFKGERLQPKAGRSDDMGWPRPAPPAVATPVTVLEPDAAVPAGNPVETGSTPPPKKVQPASKR